MEDAAQNSQLTDVARICREQFNSLLAVAGHFARLFEEDIEQIVLFKVNRFRQGNRSSRKRRHRVRQRAKGVCGCPLIVTADGGGRINGGLGKLGLTSECGLCCQRFQFASEFFAGDTVARVTNDRTDLFSKQILARCHRGQVIIRPEGTTHERPELPLRIVVYKKLFGECRLVIEHVNQKAQRTQVVANLVKGARFARLMHVHLGNLHIAHQVQQV